VLGTQSNRFEGSRIGRELVGYNARGRKAQLLEQLLHEPLRGLGVAPGLDEEVQFLTLVVDGAPQPVLLAVDAHHHLVEVPVVARPRPQAPEVGGDGRTKFQKPAPCRFLGHVDTALRQDLLNVAIRQRESGVEPDRAANDLRWETVTLEEEWAHGSRLQSQPLAEYFT